LALAVDSAVQESRQDGWRHNPLKVKKVRLAIRNVLQRDKWHGYQGADARLDGFAADAAPPPSWAGKESIDDRADRILELVTHQHEY
jgi:hypothetical protein